MADADEYSRAVVGNRAFYVDDVTFFRLLQDKGEKMDDQTRERFAKGSRKVAFSGEVVSYFISTDFIGA